MDGFDFSFIDTLNVSSLEDDDSEIDTTKMSSRAITIYLKNLETHYVKSGHLQDLAGIPKPGEQIRIVTEKQFNAFALILLLLQARQIEEMWIAIYRINEPTVAAIIDMINKGMIKRGGFVISSFFNQTKKPERWALMLKDFCSTNPRFAHCYTHNHAKVVVIKTSLGEHIVFEGSGNMSDNARIEQYLYENNKEAYEFHRKWMMELTGA